MDITDDLKEMGYKFLKTESEISECRYQRRLLLQQQDIEDVRIVKDIQKYPEILLDFQPFSLWVKKNN